MGCNQSSENQWAYSSNNAPTAKAKPMAIVAPVPVQHMETGITGEVDRGTIEEYVELEKEIASHEAQSPALILQQKRNQLVHLEERIKQQEENVEALDEQTQLIRHNHDLIGTVDEHALDDDIRKHLLELSEDRHDEKREALAVLNNKEIAKTELANLTEQRLSLEAEITALAAAAEQLQGLYGRQDQLLKRIFGGEYGSVEENHLEELLDQEEELRNRIVEANFKWKQAQLMVDYAFKQLNEAVAKWQTVPNIDDSRLEEKYSIAMIARNNLVAAAQNIQGAQRYLTNVEFPYCSPSEVATLNKATAYIFTDMQTTERHGHAGECYETTAKRCGALLQWINMVVHTTIAKDLENSNSKVHEASTGLRKERIKLIKEKAKEITGEDIDIDVVEIDTDVKVGVNVNELARTEGIDPNLLATLSAKELEMLKSINNDDLAPPPSDEDIFGQIESIKKQFEEENSQLTRQLEENKMRMNANFQEKLAARRQRRARHKREESELKEHKKKDKKDKHHKKDKKHHKDKKHKKDKHHEEDHDDDHDNDEHDNEE